MPGDGRRHRSGHGICVAGEPFPAISSGMCSPPTPCRLAMAHQGRRRRLQGVCPWCGGLVGYDPIAGSKVDKPIDGPWLALSTCKLATPRSGSVKGAPTAASKSTACRPVTTLCLLGRTAGLHPQPPKRHRGDGETVDLGFCPFRVVDEFEGYVLATTPERRDGLDGPERDGCPTGGDEGEAGMANFTLTMRKRENSLMDRGATLVTTDGCGHYYMENAYPMTQWLVMEAYADLYLHHRRHLSGG